MILITEFMDRAAVDRLAAEVPTTYAPDLADTPADIPRQLDGRRALIVRNRTQVTAELLDSAPELDVVGRLGVGLDNIDQLACAERGISVIPATGANTASVAEYVVTTALVLLRGAYQVNERMLSGEWPRQDCSGREAAGRTLGLVGFGAIARETARLAGSMGMRVCAHDPFLAPTDSAWGDVTSLDLDELLASSDVVSLHVPLTADTHHLIDGDRIGGMKPGALLINTARGGVVDEHSLAEALRNGRLGGAALDVFEVEPLTADAAERFRGLSNVVLTPHIAGVTYESNVRVSAMIAERVLRELDRVAAQ